MDLWFDSRGGLDADTVADMTLGLDVGLGMGVPPALEAAAAAALPGAGPDEPTTVKRQRLAAQQADSAFGYTKARNNRPIARRHGRDTFSQRAAKIFRRYD